MQRKIIAITLDRVKLDQENVRFGGDIAHNQREAIELMMADPEDAKKILKLADHIATHGLDPTELQLVMPAPDDCYIVLEGNRRLTALKLLQKPDLCPSEKLVKPFMAAHKKIGSEFPTQIEFSIVPTREDGDIWVELKHTGQNGGVGRVNWDSDIRDERRARQTGIESIGRQVRNLVSSNEKVFSNNTISDIFSIPVTTLTRLFSSKPAQEIFQLKIVNKQIIPQLKLEYIAPAVEFAIDLFKNEDYNVNDIRSDDDRKLFMTHIPPELLPLSILRKQASTADTGQGNQGSETKDISSSNPSTAGTHSPAGLSSAAGIETPYATGPRTKAKPSSKARKYLLPWSLNVSNSRINEIYRELRKNLEVDTCPNAAAITFRVFIETSCDDFIVQEKARNTPIIRDDNRKPLTEDMSLASKVIGIVKHLELAGKIDRNQSKAISKRANDKDTLGSVDHFNQFVHSSASSPLPSELKDIADEYRPMLEAIWK
ncbi:Uncharacterized protein ALO80_04746 [Pseudomonas caricapapayae]|uniref:hypothetical protein n=2 Tax=Pseudomonas caricapapayae TaxID=46678 RepID=UPI0006D5DE30|nr:hypothetical protein [Pseudomonas caricapapayae]KAA8690082.1 hypothetical protein F4W67_26980 [Pseudomonas caricapapayae]KPW53759.1 Uncharacterized protein ALO80_04746 [Pseudomonas caricapapayae]